MAAAAMAADADAEAGPAVEVLAIDCLRSIAELLELRDVLALCAVNKACRRAASPLISSIALRDQAELRCARPWAVFPSAQALALKLEQHAARQVLVPAVEAFVHANRESMRGVLTSLAVELADAKGYGRRVARQCLASLLPHAALAQLLAPGLTDLSVTSPDIDPALPAAGEAHRPLQEALESLRSLTSLTCRWARTGCARPAGRPRTISRAPCAAASAPAHRLPAHHPA